MRKILLPVLMFLLAVPCAAVPPAPPPPEEGMKPLDTLNYGSTDEFRKAWQASAASTAGRLEKIDGQSVALLPCGFDKNAAPRAFWDFKVKADLQQASALVFDIYIDHPEGIGTFTVYLGAKDGRYSYSAWNDAALAGGKWYRLYLPLAKFERGINLADVSFVRLSPWKSRAVPTVVYVANPGYDDRPGRIVVLNKNTTPYIAGKSRFMTDYLAMLGIRSQSVTTENLKPGDIEKAELVIVPFYPAMTAETAQVLADFIAAGGKVIACHYLHPVLGKAIGAKAVPFPGGCPPPAEMTARLKYMEIAEPPAWVPEQVINVFGQPNCLRTAAEDAKNFARWRYYDGSDAGFPAVITSSRGACLSNGFNHNRDREGQRRLYLYLIAAYAPGERKALAENRLREIDAALGEADWRASFEVLKKQNGYGPRSEKLAQEAGGLRSAAQAAFKSGDYMDSIRAALDARDKITNAFFCAQKPVPGEFRGYVFQHADGLAGDTWDESVRLVRNGGFTDILVNLQGGCAAAYPSEYVPYYDSWHSPGVRDNLTLCLEACRKYGVRLHVWTSNLKLLYCPAGQRRKLEEDGRLQVGTDGRNIDWLCPTHPENIKVQGDLMAYAAKRGAAGVHYDYIRYEFEAGCYCGRCRGLFEKRIGYKVASWPKDVFGAGPLNAEFRRFRQDNITNIVHETSRRVRAISPEVVISGAFVPYPACLTNFSQDWMKWVKSGDLDIVLPMMYTKDVAYVREAATYNLKNCPVPSYSCIGSYKLSPVEVIRQINAVREAGGRGWALFSMAADGENYLKALRQGITADAAVDK